jgi:hypothetical protein
MDIQMMVLILLSVMLVAAVVYLVVFEGPEQDYEHNSLGHHHDHWS